MRLRTSLTAWILALVLLAAADAEVLTPEKLSAVKLVTEARISPDGQHVAYVLRSPQELELEGDQELGAPWSELHVVDRSGRSRPYVTGKVSVSDIGWTPDGQKIAYLAKREGDEQKALYAIPLAGGESKELLELSEGINDYSFSPDGRRVAVLSTRPKVKERKKLEKKGLNAEVYEEDWRPVQIFVYRLGTDSDDLKPLEVEGSASEIRWSPDGGKLSVALAPNPGVDADLMFRRIRILDAAAGKLLASVDNPGKLGQVEWNPAGTHLALISGADLHDPAEGRLMVVPAAGGPPVDVLPGLPAHVVSFSWLDNERLRALAHQGVQAGLYEISRTGGGKTTVSLDPLVGDSLSTGKGGGSAILGSSPSHPQEVYLYEQGKARRLTDSNPWLSAFRRATQEAVRYKARDGLELEGILIRPLDEEPGKRYPLILTVHGGPESHYSNGWLTSYSMPGQIGAARGFAIFHPNYRGSTGRGVEFSKLGQGDPAGKEFDDLVDAVDHLVQAGLVDKDKVGITGGSYGGYASAWGATAQTDRFAASVMFVGISDKISKTGTTDIPEEEFLVHALRRPWDNWQLYFDRSPIRHVQEARTPLLILHGKDDPRVHPSQSMELYRFLKLLGKVPVRLVLYPGEGHGNRKVGPRYDYNLRMLQWMEHYLKGPGGAPPAYEIDYGLAEEEEK